MMRQQINAEKRNRAEAEDLRITARAVQEAPKYKKTAAALLDQCRAFYQNPENERAYQEWKARKDGQLEKTAI